MVKSFYRAFGNIILHGTSNYQSHDSIFQVLVFCDASTRSYGASIISPCAVFTKLEFCKMTLTPVDSEGAKNWMKLVYLYLSCWELFVYLILLLRN